jgi:predicted  nucleic acid-binding Zn-ribbon protein
MVDVDGLINSRDSKYQEKLAYERQQQNISEKLRRLRAAKSAVSDIKNNIAGITKRVKKSTDQLGQWRGNEYKWLKSFVENDMASNYGRYHKDVDTVLDHICDEITRLENENSRLGGVIGFLKNAINDLTNEIEKLLN